MYVRREHGDSHKNAGDISGGIAWEKGDNRKRSRYIQNGAVDSCGEDELRHRDKNEIRNSSGDIDDGVGESDGKDELDDSDEDDETPKDFDYVLTENF